MDALLQTLSNPFDLASRVSASLAGGTGFRGATPLALLLVAVVAGLAFWLLRRRGDYSHNVTARRAFSQANGVLWSRLRQALPEHIVLMDVPLTRFIMVRRIGGIGRNQRRVDLLIADFAVFRSDGTISSVVLLDEPELGLPRGQVRLRRRLLARAGVRTVHWRLDAMPTTDAIMRELNPDPAGYLVLEKGVAQRGIGAIGIA
ncbi:MAG: hypothetical protein AB7G13_02240 [Lautropia sp.]